MLLSQQNINITSGQSHMSLSPEAVTVNTPAFSIYTQQESEDGEEARPVLRVANQSVTVNANSLEVGINIILQHALYYNYWPRQELTLWAAHKLLTSYIQWNPS